MAVVHGRHGIPSGPLSTCLREIWCYCWSCQVDRLQFYERKHPNVLLADLYEAERREEDGIEAAFTEVLKQICISKAFRKKYI